MQKYFLVFKNAWQVGWSYRESLAIKALTDVIFTISLILLWSVVYKIRSEIAGFTFPAIVTYYLLVRVLDLLYTLYPAKYLTNQIKTGNLSSFLVKPLNYFSYNMSNSFGLKLARSAITLLLILTFFILFPQYIVFPPNIIYVLALIPFGVLSWLIYSQLAFILGISAFWTSETGNLRTALALSLSILSGGWFPLNFFPPVVLTIINWLPIKFLYFYIIQLYQGKIPVNHLPLDLVQITFWFLVLFFIANKLFVKGVRHYESFGN